MKQTLFLSIIFVANFLFANDIEREISGFFSKSAGDYARTKLGDLNPRTIPKEFLQEAISLSYIRNYNYLLEYQRSQANRDVPFTVSWYAPVFTCKNQRLETVKIIQVLGNMPMNPKNTTDQFLVDAKGDFEFRGYNCSAKGNFEEGVVKSMSAESCSFLKVGKNVFLYGGPLYNFPEAAHACCQIKGCAEKVYSELLKSLKEFSSRADNPKPKINIK